MIMTVHKAIASLSLKHRMVCSHYPTNLPGNLLEGETNYSTFKTKQPKKKPHTKKKTTKGGKIRKNQKTK